MSIKSIHDISDSAAKTRLLKLPHITTDGITDWIHREDFGKYGFNTSNGVMRNGIPEHFPKGMLWERWPEKGTIQKLRCLGFTDEHQYTDKKRTDICKIIKSKPCIITGSTTNIEVDHRAGNKRHPLHIRVDNVDEQTVDDFMPLCRSMNQIKREICKKCIASGSRPEQPPFLGGGPMKQGQGCYRCFWFEPESYI